MKRILFIGAAVLLPAAALTVSASPSLAAPGKNTCPANPAPGSRVNGGLVVTGSCLLDGVTVNGGAIVTSSGHLELEDSSIIHGGVTVQGGGELDLGHAMNSSTPTFTPNTIDGGLTDLGGFDLDLNNATIHGAVDIESLAQAPTICKSSFDGSVTINNVVATLGALEPGLVGDPGEPAISLSGQDCPANTFHGSLFVSNSTNIEIEGNTINGSVFISNSTIGFSGNKITGSTHCQNVVTAVDSDDAPSQCP